MFKYKEILWKLYRGTILKRYMQKKIVSMLCIMCCVTSLVPFFLSGNALEIGDIYHEKFVLNFNPQDLIFSKMSGYDLVSLNGCDILTDVGKPQLPIKMITIALPAGIQAENVYIEGIQTTQIPGQYVLYPSQPAVTTMVSTQSPSVIQSDKNTYASSQPYPSKIIEMIGQTDLAGQPLGEILVYPLQYVPDEHRLVMYTTLSFIVTGRSGYVCGDYLPDTMSANGRSTSGSSPPRASFFRRSPGIANNG